MNFGARLQGLRERAGLSQTGLADAAGVSVDSVQNWEQGRTRPRLEALGKLASALAVTVDELVREDHTDKERPKRSRGRPPKPAEEPAPKRPRGRPKKRV